MKIDMKMKQVVNDVHAHLNCNGDADTNIEVRVAIKKFDLDHEETKYLCQYFGIQMSDVL